MKLAVVIAAYNERDNIEPLTRRLVAVLDDLGEWRSEIVYVVEGTDGTKELVERLAAELRPIQLLYQSEPGGLANAFRRGFSAVPPDSDFIVTMDADLNHQPEEIPRLLRRIVAADADILVGSRFIGEGRAEGMPIWKTVISRLVNWLMGYLFDLNVRDKTSGFRIYKAAALQSIEFANSGFAFLPEILLRSSAAGMTIIEEPIHFIYRTRGTSKMDFWKTSRSYVSLLRAHLRAKAGRR